MYKIVRTPFLSSIGHVTSLSLPSFVTVFGLWHTLACHDHRAGNQHRQQVHSFLQKADLENILPLTSCDLKPIGLASSGFICLYYIDCSAHLLQLMELYSLPLPFCCCTVSSVHYIYHKFAAVVDYFWKQCVFWCSLPDLRVALLVPCICVKCLLKYTMGYLRRMEATGFNIKREALCLYFHEVSPLDLPYTLKTTKILSSCQTFCQHTIFLPCMLFFSFLFFSFLIYSQSIHTYFWSQTEKKRTKHIVCH